MVAGPAGRAHGLPGSTRALLSASWLVASLAFAATTAFLSAPAAAVSTANDEYTAALRLKPHPQHGQQIFELCAACHGSDGRGASDGSVPAIAGQYVPVLVKQLIDFRYDTRHAIRVQGFISHHQLTSQDLADVAAYVSALPPREPRPAPEAQNAAHGADIFDNLCAGCHGYSGEGSSATRVPRLAGQHPEYLAEQLRDASEGGRPSMERDHARVLRPLSVDDMNAIASYLAGVAPTSAPP